MKKRYLIIFIVLFLFNVKNAYAEGKNSFLVQRNEEQSKIVKINCTQTSPDWPACQNKTDTEKPTTTPTDPTDPNNHNKPGEGAPSGPEIHVPGASGQQDKDQQTVEDNRKEEDPFHIEKQDNGKQEEGQSGNGSTDDLIKKDQGMLKYATCESLFSGEGGKDLLDLLSTIVNIIKISIPLLLLALGILDFSKATFAGSEEDMKKSQKKFIKRVIIGICIFLIPTVLKLVLNIGNQVWGDLISPDFCGILKI